MEQMEQIRQEVRHELEVRRETAAHALIDALIDHGIDTVFGLPGGGNIAFYDAAIDRPALRVITSRHESGAVFAAMGYARLTGRPAAVVVTAGPGLTNALTGLAAAHCEDVPVVLIAGDVPGANAGRFAFQDGSAAGLDVLSLTRPLCRWSARVERGQGIDGLVHMAVREACGTRPGPVFLSVPLDVWRAPYRRTTFHFSQAATLVPPRDGCQRAAHLLSEAKRPLIILGAGARYDRATDFAVALAERTGAMATATSHGKGAFPERHRHYLGVLGLAGHSEVLEYLKTADVTLVVGSRLGDLSTNGWSGSVAPSRALIHADREPAPVGRNYATDVAIIGDAAEVLEAIIEALPTETLRRPPVAAGLSPTQGEQTPQPTAPIKPQWLMGALSRGLPANTIFTVDCGEHSCFAVHHLRVDRPDRFHHFAGLGSMGSGFCSAVGMKVARPNQPVVAIVGDGGFAMHSGELLTCVDAGIPVMWVVLNDGRFRMVDAGFRQIFGRIPAELPHTMADLAGIATACGAVGITVRNLDELGPGRLHALLALRRPIVLDVRIDPEEFLSTQRVAALKQICNGGLSK